MLEVLTGGLNRLYGANLINTRIGLVYGPDDPNEHRLVPSVIKCLPAGPAALLSSGRRRCDWIYVSDVAEALAQCRTDQPARASRMDIGTGKLISIRRVAEVIRGHMGTPLEPIYLGGTRPAERAGTGCRCRANLPGFRLARAGEPDRRHRQDGCMAPAHAGGGADVRHGRHPAGKVASGATLPLKLFSRPPRRLAA